MRLPRCAFLSPHPLEHFKVFPLPAAESAASKTPAPARVDDSTLFSVSNVGSLRLDGSGDYVEISFAGGLNHLNVITIEAWVKRDAYRCETVVGNGWTTSYWLVFCTGPIRFYHTGSMYVDGNANSCTDLYSAGMPRPYLADPPRGGTAAQRPYAHHEWRAASGTGERDGHHLGPRYGPKNRTLVRYQTGLKSVECGQETVILKMSTELLEQFFTTYPNPRRFIAMRFNDLSELEVIEETALQAAAPEWGGLVCIGGACGLICIGI